MINPESNHFLSYDLLEINPQEIFKSKRKQELAIFELSKGIACMIKENNPSTFQRLCEIFEETCRKLSKK